MSQNSSGTADAWASGDAYEPYVGRWSRLVARQFLSWLEVPSGKSWLDVGCGTGALVQTILSHAAPVSVTGVDQSDGFVDYARQHTQAGRAVFKVGDAQSLPVEDENFDAVVSGLVLNFVPQPDRMVAEMTRAARPRGVVACYVWDYAGEMQLIRRFWDAAVALDPAAGGLDEGVRFPICKPQPLAELFAASGLANVTTRAIDIPTHFDDFDDFWSPFLGGQGPAPGYCMSLDEDRRAALREYIRERLPVQPDGTIKLTARAWAVKGAKV